MKIHTLVVCNNIDGARVAYLNAMKYLRGLKANGLLTQIGHLDDRMMIRIGETRDYRIRFMSKSDVQYLDKGFSTDEIMSRCSMSHWVKNYEEIIGDVIAQDQIALGWTNTDPNVTNLVYLYSDGYKDPMQELINEISPENYGDPDVNIAQRKPVWKIGDKLIITPLHVRYMEPLFNSKFSGAMITIKTVTEHREKLKNELLNIIALT